MLKTIEIVMCVAWIGLWGRSCADSHGVVTLDWLGCTALLVSLWPGRVASLLTVTHNTPATAGASQGPHVSLGRTVQSQERDEREKLESCFTEPVQIHIMYTCDHCLNNFSFILSLVHFSRRRYLMNQHWWWHFRMITCYDVDKMKMSAGGG